MKEKIRKVSDDVAIYVEPEKRMPLVVILMLGFVGPAMFGYGLSTAMVAIGTEVKGMAMVAWLFTAANLVQMVMQPLIPAISSKVTLPRLVLFGLVAAVGSLALFMAAPNMSAMIGLRAVAGLAGAIINTGCLALAGQIVPPEKRATVTGFNMAFNGVGSVGGPLLAGICVDAGRWRMWTLITLVIMIVALVLYIIYYPKGVKPEEGAKFDGKGAVLLSVGFVALACLLQLSGNFWPWVSPITLGLLILTIGALVCFVHTELKIERENGRPAFRVSLFKTRTFLVAALCAFVACIGTNGIATYVPAYGQTMLGLSATQSGLGYSIGSILVIVLSLFNGYFFGKKRWFKQCNAFGCGVGILISALFLVIGENLTAIVFISLIAFYAIWTAWIGSVNFTIGQMMLPTEDVLDATAGITSMQMIGAFLGVSLNTAIINMLGYNGLFGVCIVSFALCIVIMMFLKDAPKEEA